MVEAEELELDAQHEAYSEPSLSLRTAANPTQYRYLILENCDGRLPHVDGCVGGPFMTRYGPWLVGDLGVVDRESGWGYISLEVGVIDSRIISPEVPFLWNWG